MKKEFVPIDIAIELRELGFDEPCYLSSHFNEENDEFIPTPLYQQAFRFFREKYGLNYEIPYAGKTGEYYAFVQGYVYGKNEISPSRFTYEEAELACIKKLIEMVKNK